MTAIDQDAAAERAVRELERRLRMFLPPPLLADANAFATAFLHWQIDHDWRCWPRSQVAVAARKQGVAPDRHAGELAAARARCAEVSARHATESGR